MNRKQQAKNNGARARLAKQRASPAAPRTPAIAANSNANADEASGTEALGDEAASSHQPSAENNNGTVDNVPDHVPDHDVPDNTVNVSSDSIPDDNVPTQLASTEQSSDQQAAGQETTNQESDNQGASNQIPDPDFNQDQDHPFGQPAHPVGHVPVYIPYPYFHTLPFNYFTYNPQTHAAYAVPLNLASVPIFVNNLILLGFVPLYLIALVPIQGFQVPDFQLFPNDNDPADEDSYSEGLFDEEEVGPGFYDEDYGEDHEQDYEQDDEQDFDLSYYFGEHHHEEEVPHYEDEEVEYIDYPSSDHSNDQVQDTAAGSGEDSDNEVSDGEEEDDSDKDCDQDDSDSQDDSDDQDNDNQGGTELEGPDNEHSDQEGSDGQTSNKKTSDSKASDSEAANNPRSSGTTSEKTSEEPAKMASQNLASMVIPPNHWRYARACMVCSIIMTQAHFRAEGCPNCPFLDLKGSPEAIEACTSSQFEGTMACFQPRRSWVARWQRVDTFVPGTYAIKTATEGIAKQGGRTPQQAEREPAQQEDSGKGKGKENAQKKKKKQKKNNKKNKATAADQQGDRQEQDEQDEQDGAE
ncbi:Spt4/RpoE2 zinc finger-domain-containing protein [Daldinia eschscholtzii]|nr:Spt4/RpoE2 zinc finger-domain-containing protein [Daldinia eschscholtzii]